MRHRSRGLGLPIPALILTTALALTACGAQSTTGGSDDSGSGGGELAAVPGFDPEAGTITVGNIVALSGPISDTAKEQLVGQQAWFDHVNADGGIAGKYQVELVTADNQYDAQVAVQAYQQIKDQVVMFSGILGTPSVKALLPILERDEAVAVPSNQAAELRNEPSLLPTFPSYQTNVNNAVAYLNEQDPSLKDAKYCVLGYENDWGDAVVEGLTFATEQLGTTVTSVQNYAPLDTALTAQMQELKGAGCQVVAFSGAANNMPSVVAAATQLDFKPTWIAEFIANSTAFNGTPIAQYLADNVLFTGPGADLTDDSIEGIKILHEALGDTPLTLQHVYGYIEAVAVTTLLEQGVEDGDLSGPGLRESQTKMEKIDFQGLNGALTLGEPADRKLPQSTSIYRYDPATPYGLSVEAAQYQAEETDPKF
jgi:ABC-type branched-subunit amino acid transport system substrate-binding protein